jgi:hypothetical protein
MSILHQRYPRITIIENKENLGFTGGYNRGIAHALDLGVPYIVLLNDDAIIAPDTLSKLAQTAESNPEIGICGPKILAVENPNILLAAGGIIPSNWKPFFRGSGEPDDGKYDVKQEMDFLSGCALLVSRNLILAVGSLDDRFFAYYEDIDWCYRARKKGFKLLYVPQAKVWHPDTRSRDENSSLVPYYNTRNQLLFCQKHHLGLNIKTRIIADTLRTIISWSLRPKWKSKISQRNAMFRGLIDFMFGKFGRADRLM